MCVCVYIPFPTALHIVTSRSIPLIHGRKINHFLQPTHPRSLHVGKSGCGNDGGSFSLPSLSYKLLLRPFIPSS